MFVTIFYREKEFKSNHKNINLAEACVQLSLRPCDDRSYGTAPFNRERDLGKGNEEEQGRDWHILAKQSLRSPLDEPPAVNFWRFFLCKMDAVSSPLCTQNGPIWLMVEMS